MRLRAIAFAVAASGATAGGAWLLAQGGVDYLERTSRDELAEALAMAGQSWVTLDVDGLTVSLGGEAPDETSRFRTIEIAKQIVSGRRVHDRITVAQASPLAAPPFALELLRNDGDVSLIGLVPAAGGREAITTGLTAAGLGGTVTDMLETADHPAPPGWSASLRFGLAVLADLPRAKIQVGPGTVAVEAVADSEAERAALAERLAAAAPEGVALALELSAPRAVVAPFVVEYRLDDAGGRLLACTAETEADAAAILAAARASGLASEPDCTLGLGAPTPDWAEAAELGIAAVAQLGGGRFALSDIEAQLAGPAGIDPGRLAAVGAGLGGTLPAVFSLATRGEVLVATEAGDELVHAPEFRAVLLGDGRVRLTGPVLDHTARIAIVGFAEALFGHENVINTTVLDPALPEGWPGRVLAGVEALSLLEEGRLEVTAETVTLSGRSMIEAAEQELTAFFAAKGNGPAVIDVAYDAAAAAAADAAAEAAAHPPEEACADAIKAILADEMILFETGSSSIDSESEDVIAAIAATLQSCPGADFEIGGHTDSRGPAAFNQQLSEARAQAVQAALEAHALPLIGLTARGYGPDAPIADNATAEGRALNRRIEFTPVPTEDAGTDAEVEPVAEEKADDGNGDSEADDSASEADSADADADAVDADDQSGTPE